MPDTYAPTDLQRLAQMFRAALQGLGVSPPDNRLEQWSILVHASMSAEDRDYHGIEHVFEVAQGADPTVVLAALFHDSVYLRAQSGLPGPQQPLLADVVEMGPKGWVLLPFDSAANRHRAMLEAIFGTTPDTPLSPLTGLNEFLSAMLALRSLEAFLPSRVLLEIGAAIEATIPFRCGNGGEAPAQALFARLQRVDAQFDLELGPEALQRTVHRAVDLANRDVAGFAVADSGLFLDSTWRLLPESNSALRGVSTYTLEEYRLGLHNMTRFFAGLDPQTVFCRFQGVPDRFDYECLTARARSNIQHAHRYLEAKLAAISLLSALARLTGGDAPTALFMGDLPEPGRPKARLEAFLPDPGPPCREANTQVFTLLNDGRRNHSRFDIKNSPLAALIYGRLGDPGIQRLTRDGTHPMDNGYAGQLLDSIPPGLLREIIHACSQIATTRAEGLLKLIEE